MILFYGEGRLGNQIFQYQALSRLARPRESVFAIGLEDLAGTIELGGARLIILTRNRIIKRLVKYAVIPLVLRPVARFLRLVNYVTETRHGTPPNSGEGGEMSIRRGLIRTLTFVEGGHYQNSTLWSKLCPAEFLRINAKLRDSARLYLESVAGPMGRPTFVHVRRGDYVLHTDFGLSDLSLPVEFYRRAITEYENRVGKSCFFFVTDDPEWVADNFRDIAGKTITAFEASMDFAIMTECRGGILSNSTFSLAAAFLMNQPELVIAPEYWNGFRAAQWLPPKIKATHDRILYLQVLADAAAA